MSKRNMIEDRARGMKQQERAEKRYDRQTAKQNEGHSADGGPMYQKPPYDYMGAIIAYENGELEQDEVIVLFQYLVDTGLAWTLQGSYGRAAAALIDAGEVSL